MTESENIHATFEDAIYCAKSWCGEVACEVCRLYPLGDIFCQDTSRIMAQAMEDLVKYRAIGTVSEFKQLKEKATAKKVITKGQGHETDCYCPNCNKFLGDDQEWCFNQTKHCSECGQALEEY